MKGRTWFLASGIAIALVVVAVYLWSSRFYILESWYLLRFDSLSPSGKAEAIEALGRCGSTRSAEKLLPLAGDENLGSAAARALEGIIPRLRADRRAAAVEKLLEVFGASDRPPAELAELGPALIRMGRAHIELLPAYLGTLRQDKPAVHRIAAAVIFHHVEAGAVPIAGLLADSRPEEVAALLLPSHLTLLRISRPAAGIPDPPFEVARRAASDLEAFHPNPRVRATALAFRILAGKDGNGLLYDPEPLARAYAKDPSPVVKAAALRLAGYIGDRPGGPDLVKVIETEKDPALLAEAVQARTLWTEGGDEWPWGEGLELWDGFTCGWIPRQEGPRKMGSRDGKPLSEAEIKLLAGILARSADMDLRDACSMALAARHRPKSQAVRKTRTQRLEGFRVHEWGVWRDVGKALIPAGKVLADLPAFVHRYKITAEELIRGCSYTPMEVLKPVVFFYAPEPLPVLVQAGFHGGRPWTFFPQATDYRMALRTERPPGSSSGTVPGAGGTGPPRASALLDGEEDVPQEGVTEASSEETSSFLQGIGSDPRARMFDFRGQILGTADGNPESLRSFYHLVPWLIPNHPRWPTRTGPGIQCLSAIGLEWCGLRVGYPADLEGKEPAADPASWWSFLREVPCAPVSVRGEREKFLFYDGDVDAPGPIEASWADASEEKLLLEVRPFDAYPGHEGVPLEWWWGDAREREPAATAPIPAAFVISFPREKKPRGCLIEGLSPDSDPVQVPVLDLPLDEAGLRKALDERLRREGLTAEETRALERTWEKDFFETPGLRVLSLLPRWMYDGMVPLRVFPEPWEFVRVGLVWRECEGLAVAGEKERLEAREALWRPKPWKLGRGKFEIAREKMPPGASTPLEIRGDGEVVLPAGIPGSPALSADGSKLAFSILEGSTCRVLRADLKASALEEVFQVPDVKMDRSPRVSVSADGERVALALAGSKDWETRVADRGRGILWKLAGVHGGVTPDGRKVLTREQGKRLLAIDLEAGEAATVIEDDLRGLLISETISGDGRRTAFALEAGGNREVYLVDLEAETILNLSRSKGLDDFPSLSGDGRRVLFLSQRTGNADLFLADLDARRLANITESPEGDVEATLLPDGKRIVYRQGGGFVAWNLETGARNPIPGTERVWNLEVSAGGDRAASIEQREDKTVRLRILDLRW